MGRMIHEASDLQWLQQLAVIGLLTLVNRVPAPRASILALITSDVFAGHLFN